MLILHCIWIVLARMTGTGAMKRKTGLTPGENVFMWLGVTQRDRGRYREPGEHSSSCFSNHVLQLLSWCSAKRKFSALVVRSKGMLIRVLKPTTTLYRNVLWSNTQKKPQQERKRRQGAYERDGDFAGLLSLDLCKEIQHSQGWLRCTATWVTLKIQNKSPVSRSWIVSVSFRRFPS